MAHSISLPNVIINNGGPLIKVEKLTQDIRGLSLGDYDTLAHVQER